MVLGRCEKIGVVEWNISSVLMSDSMMLHDGVKRRMNTVFLCPKDKNLGDLICKEFVKKRKSACDNLEHTQHVFVRKALWQRGCGGRVVLPSLSFLARFIWIKGEWSGESKETKGLSFTGCHMPMPSRYL